MSDKLRSDSFRWQDTGWDDPLAAWSEFARNLELELLQANERIKRLESIIIRAANQCFCDGSDGRTAALMLKILEAAKEAKP